MDVALYENKWTLVCRVRDLFDSLWRGGILVESLWREDGSDFGRDFRNIVRGLGHVDASGIRLGLDGGLGVHGIFGGGVHLARGRGLVGGFGG